jgi:hypothetical protein
VTRVRDRTRVTRSTRSAACEGAHKAFFSAENSRSARNFDRARASSFSFGNDDTTHR